MEFIDYFVFGYWYFFIEYMLKNGYSCYINLGEWFFSNFYVVFDGDFVNLVFFENEEGWVFGGGQFFGGQLGSGVVGRF